MNFQEAIAQGAQLYLPMADGGTPELYYRWTFAICSDGSFGLGLSFLSLSGSWRGSDERAPREFSAQHLLPIPGADQTVKPSRSTNTSWRPPPNRSYLEHLYVDAPPKLVWDGETWIPETL